MSKINDYFAFYEKNLNLINSLIPNKKTRIKARIFAVLIALLVLIGPILLIGSLFVFEYLLYIAIALEALCIILLLFLNDVFYLILLKNYCEEIKIIKYGSNLLVNLFIYLIVCSLCAICSILTIMGCKVLWL